VITGAGNVGIGTTTPENRLSIVGGNVSVTGPGDGVVLKSPNGSLCRHLGINDSGEVVLRPATCE
jgi:hypothetical protein